MVSYCSVFNSRVQLCIWYHIAVFSTVKSGSVYSIILQCFKQFSPALYMVSHGTYLQCFQQSSPALYMVSHCSVFNSQVQLHITLQCFQQSSPAPYAVSHHSVFKRWVQLHMQYHVSVFSSWDQLTVTETRGLKTRSVEHFKTKSLMFLFWSLWHVEGKSACLDKTVKRAGSFENWQSVFS